MPKTPQTVFRIIRLNLHGIACALSVLSTTVAARAAEPAAHETTLQLGAPFADHAVFQQGIPLPIWGTAGPGAKIEATFAGQTKTASTNADGTWRVTLDPLKAVKLKSVNDTPETHTLKITSTLDGGQDVRELRDIVIGDVWLCAGQSNIAGSIRKAVNPKNHPPDSVADANYPGLRFLKVENQSWDVCTPETVLGCSRVAFFDTLALPNTGMAVAIDVGTKGEHPPNKFDTAERLTRSVLQKVHELENITACPLYKSHKVEGNTVRISFTDDAENGLMIAKKATTLPDAFEPATPTPDAKLQWLSIQDEGGQWHWADAKIDGAELIVFAEGVMKPIAVRYAYTTQPLGHLLYNKDGMPVGPFSTSGHNAP